MLSLLDGAFSHFCIPACFAFVEEISEILAKVKVGRAMKPPEPASFGIVRVRWEEDERAPMTGLDCCSQHPRQHVKNCRAYIDRGT
jgi:hypothetical protein